MTRIFNLTALVVIMFVAYLAWHSEGVRHCREDGWHGATVTGRCLEWGEWNATEGRDDE